MPFTGQETPPKQPAQQKPQAPKDEPRKPTFSDWASI